MHSVVLSYNHKLSTTHVTLLVSVDEIWTETLHSKQIFAFTLSEEILAVLKIVGAIFRQSADLNKIGGRRGVFGFSELRSEFAVLVSLVICFGVEMILGEVVWVGSISMNEEVCDSALNAESEVSEVVFWIFGGGILLSVFF